ncbi:type II toxin-antitoxin system HicA family toxin [Companilactobacillus kedongensis]|uniref:type II toxin-antitoxin system HicA family toxin n=1 Tax=Companilactobacillus kedongensis TaxID=2486004 RepID=UPI000F793EFB|nr:type II toxin-antitoxin system HicA family toxin [Companilactobacillus kedongensis]
MEYLAKDVVKLLKDHGFYEVRMNGDHHRFDESNGLAESIINASEALGLILYDEPNLPGSSSLKDISNSNPECVVSLVSVDLDEVSKSVKIPMISKNTRIPSDLAREAEKRHINFSEILVEGLKEKLQA